MSRSRPVVLPTHRTLAGSAALICAAALLVSGPVADAATSHRPTVNSVSSTSGPDFGKRRVTITGTNFTHVTAVHFGRSKGTQITVSSSRTLSVLAPKHAAGTVDVTVSTHSGTSATQKHDRYHYEATNCTGMASGGAGTTVWTSAYSSALAAQFRRLVCSAADHSTILVKSWFIVPDGAPADSVLSALKLMHDWHHVTVKFLVGRNGYDPDSKGQSGQKVYNSFAKFTAGWAASYQCTYACYLGTSTHALTHSKFFLISQLKGSRTTAVVSTGSNITTQQLAGTAESAIAFFSDAKHDRTKTGRTLYQAFMKDWNAELGCAANHPKGTRCTYKRSQQPVATTVGPVRVWFAPNRTIAKSTTNSPYDIVLGQVLAKYHAGLPRGASCTVQGMTLQASDPVMLSQLQKLKKFGCSVSLLIEHADQSAKAWLAFHVKMGTNHDKMLRIVVTGSKGVRTVLAGSLNFQPGSNSNNQQTIQYSVPATTTSAHTVVGEYGTWFAKMWGSKHETAYPKPAKH